MPEHYDKQSRWSDDRPGKEPLPHSDDAPEPPRSALDELSKYPFFADDDEALDAVAPVAAPMHERALAATHSPESPPGRPTGTMVCPYLGLSLDRDKRADFASDVHRCWRTDESAPVDARWQSQVCLTGECLHCPRFRDPVATVPAPPPPPDPARGVGRIPVDRSSWPRGWGFGHYTGLAAVLLCCVLVAMSLLVGGPLRSRPAGSDATQVSAPTVAVAGNAPAPATPTLVPAPVNGGAPAQAEPPPTSTSAAATATGVSPPAPVAAAPSLSLDLDALRQRAIERQGALQTVQLDTTIDYGPGTTSTSRIQFDRGDAQRASRLSIVNSYRGATGVRTSESLRIGAQAWQRVPGGPWQSAASTDGILELLRANLFPVGVAEDLTLDGQDAATVTLRWYDPANDADVALQIDRATAIPQQWRQVLRASGQVVTVRYSSWDAPVEIPPAPQP